MATPASPSPAPPPLPAKIEVLAAASASTGKITFTIDTTTGQPPSITEIKHHDILGRKLLEWSEYFRKLRPEDPDDIPARVTMINRYQLPLDYLVDRTGDALTLFDPAESDPRQLFIGYHQTVVRRHLIADDSPPSGAADDPRRDRTWCELALTSPARPGRHPGEALISATRNCSVADRAHSKFCSQRCNGCCRGISAAFVLGVPPPTFLWLWRLPLGGIGESAVVALPCSQLLF
jgi:hypothetical protein